jgi:hypothetical protein
VHISLVELFGLERVDDVGGPLLARIVEVRDAEDVVRGLVAVCWGERF